jgi:hypothetical protein
MMHAVEAWLLSIMEMEAAAADWLRLGCVEIAADRLRLWLM